jgi:hypothetical protein
MTNIEVGFLVTPLAQSETPNTDVNESLTWPEDRWLIGWGPWIGVDKGNVFEGHLALLHIPQADPSLGGALFMRGPHKEIPSAYDYAGQLDFFPAGCGRFIKAGDTILLQLHYTDTGSDPGTFAIQGSARIFSIKA